MAGLFETGSASGRISKAAFTVNFFALRCVVLRATSENTPTLSKVGSFQLYELNVFITHRIIVYDEITRASPGYRCKEFGHCEISM